MEIFIPKWFLIVIAIGVISSVISSILDLHIYFLKRKIKKLDKENERLEEQFTCVSCGTKNCSLIYTTELGQKCSNCVPIGTN